MNTTPNCTICGDTGKLPGSDYLDCGHCGAAAERAELEEWFRETRADVWEIHQRARQMEREGQSARIADLERENSSLAYELNVAQSGGSVAIPAAAPSAPAVEQQKPLGWLRKWAFDGETPRKEKGKWVAKFRFLPITQHRAFNDDVPLYTAPQAADTDKVREALKDLYSAVDSCVDLTPELMRKARAALDSTMAAQAPVREVPGWQPIETAPKDGTCILVCRAWDADGKPMGNSHRLFTHRAAWWADEKGCNGEWIVYNSMVKDPECFFTPTHWMPVPDIDVAPLPAAPVQQEGAKP